MPDWIPLVENKLVALAEKWVKTLEDERNTVTWHLDPNACVKVTLAINVYLKAWYVCRAVDSTVNRNFRKETRKQAVGAMRQFARSNLRFNDYMDDTSKMEMGLAVRDGSSANHPRPANSPETMPENTLNPFEKKVRAVNRETRTSKRPDDACGVRYAWQLGGTKPTSAEDLPKSRFSRRTSMVISFTEKDAGQPIWFATCYENTKGETGPWSPVVQTHIW